MDQEFIIGSTATFSPIDWIEIQTRTTKFVEI